MKKLLQYLKNKYVIAGLIIIFIIIAIITVRSTGSDSDFQTALAQVGSVTERVSVTGNILPVSKANLAFEKGGIVAVVNVKVGDRVRKGDLIASLEDAGDRAALLSAQAKLDDVSRSLRPEELAAEKAKVDSATISLLNSKNDALNTVQSAYIGSQTAVTKYADTFFTNPQSANPVISVRTQSIAEYTNINNERLVVSENLQKWKAALDSATSDSSSAISISNAKLYLNTINGFMSTLSSIINNLSVGDSGLSQASIDSAVLAMNSGLSAVNEAMSSVVAADTKLKNSQAALTEATNNFNLKVAGSSSQAVQAQAASVLSYRAELSKNMIVAPLDGLITRVVPSVGEFVSPGSTAVGMISDGTYKIEANVPEADIAKISLGNVASTTLDAYGQSIDFPAVVSTIDPAETVIEGVPTYKVTLFFAQNDPRIRSGMTANLEILTRVRDGVISIPSRAVTTENNIKTVRVVSTDGKTFSSVPVQTGLKGSDGTIEIVSGLKVGDEVVTYAQ